MSVVAAVPSVVAMMPANIARKLFTHHPVVAERLLLRLCHTIRQSSQIRSVLGMARAFSRIYAVLHGACQTHEQEGLVTLENLPSQQAIALTANVSRETVSRAMQALFANKIVEKDNRRLIVRNPAALAKLARGEVELRVSKGTRRISSAEAEAPPQTDTATEPAKT